MSDRAGLRIVKRIFVYPGDEAYYPLLGMKRLHRIIFGISAKAHISSIIGFYLVDGRSPSRGD
jgi:hypothetical protein